MNLKKKVIIPSVVGLVSVGMLFAGCSNTSSQTSKEELIENAITKIASASSVDSAVDFDMDGKLSASGLEMSLNLKADFDIQADIKNAESHVSGNYNFAALGQQRTAQMEMYSVNEGSKSYTYSNVDDDTHSAGWKVSENSKSFTSSPETTFDIKQVTEVYNKLKEYMNNFSLDNKTQSKEGKDCYVVSGLIKGSDLSKIIAENSENNSLEDMKASGIDIEKLDIDIKCYFDKSNKDPYVIEFDLTNGLTNALTKVNMEGLKDGKFEVPTCKAVIKFNSFDSVKDIEVPSDVKAKAKNSSSDKDNLQNIMDSVNPLTSL